MVFKGGGYFIRVFLKFFSTHNEIKPIMMAYLKYDKRKEKEGKTYQISKKNFIENNNETNTAENQEKSPVIIMHGLFGSKKNWNSISSSLSKSSERIVYSVDLRNHGDSPHTDEFSYPHIAEDIKYTLENLDITKVCLMGHSTGGRSAMYFSLKYPQLLESIIVVDISPFYNSPNLLRLLSLISGMKKIQIDPKLSFSEGKKQAKLYLLKELKSKLLVDFLLTNFIKSENGYNWKLNLKSLEKNFYEITKPDYLPGQFDEPVLFIIGSKGDFVLKSEETDILKLFPNAKFVYLNTGHWVHTEDPQGLVNAVTDFLK